MDRRSKDRPVAVTMSCGGDIYTFFIDPTGPLSAEVDEEYNCTIFHEEVGEVRSHQFTSPPKIKFKEKWLIAYENDRKAFHVNPQVGRKN